jgi:ATP-grasp domain, R2K clade family 3
VHHIIQHDMFNEFGFRRLKDAMHELKLPYGIIKIVPFSHEIEWVEGVITGGAVPTMIWGMTTVEEVAKHYGWVPGVFKNDNFDMRVLNKMWGSRMLNADAKFYKLGEVPSYEGAMFMRPVLDTKSFTGGLINGDELDAWRAGLYELRREFTTLDLNTEVMVASPKKVHDEGRFFVVDKKVVAGSTYRVSGRVLYKSIDSGNPLALDMLRFAEGAFTTTEMMQWFPAEAFVIDIGRTDEGFKIIEVNCLNSSGFYDSNMTAVVKAIENLHNWPDTWRGTPWFEERCDKAVAEYQARICSIDSHGQERESTSLVREE